MFNNLYNINFKELTNNFSLYYVKYITIFLILFFVVSMITFIIVSYFVLKFLKLSLDNNNILFYQYNKKSQKLLDLYGNCKLTKIYLVRQPFSKFITFLLNVFTLYNYEKLINESQDNFPYHALIVFEVKLENGMKKMLLLEKNNCINISENFFINNSQEIKELKIKKRYTINYILNKTQTRLGNEKYFNWHLYKNNCHEFTKEILRTIGKYNKTNKEFIFRDKLFKIIIPSEFTLHIGNCLCVFYNIVEKYIYDSNIFN
jgi:hypothetical protein